MGSQHGDLGRGGGGVCGEGLFAWEGAPESNTGLVWAGFRFQDSSASVRRLGFLQGRWPDPEPQQEPPERVSDSGAVEAGPSGRRGCGFLALVPLPQPHPGVLWALPGKLRRITVLQLLTSKENVPFISLLRLGGQAH